MPFGCVGLPSERWMTPQRSRTHRTLPWPRFGLLVDGPDPGSLEQLEQRVARQPATRVALPHQHIDQLSDGRKSCERRHDGLLRPFHIQFEQQEILRHERALHPADQVNHRNRVQTAALMLP